MSVLKNRIARLIGEITEKSALLTCTTSHDAFVRFAAHVGNIEIDIHIGGWERSKDCFTVGGYGWSTECNINRNNNFMSNDDTLQFNDNYHDRQSVFMLEQVSSRLSGFLSGDIEVNQEEIESTLNIDVDGDWS